MKMLELLGFSEATATYLTGTCGIDSLDEIAYLDGIEDVDMRIEGATKPGGNVTTVANLKRCVYYLKHMERVQHQPISNAINLVLVRSFIDQQCHEVGFKKTSE
jgi:hypothetical protein